MRRFRCQPLSSHVRGNAMFEVLVALLALTPFIIGIPLLGKQLDIKHKAFDAARYSVWERTVWRNDGNSNRKADEDISLEARDRTLGDPRAAMLAVDNVRGVGITENQLWRDRKRQRMLDYQDDTAPVQLEHQQRTSPVDVGYWLVPGIAYGGGPVGAIAESLQVDGLNLNNRAFASARVSIGIRPLLSQLAQRRVTLGIRGAANDDEEATESLVQTASGAILSDSWSARDENSMRRAVDHLTTDELLETLELPGKPIALQALGKGKLLYGEGQYGWNPDLKPRSTTLPTAYVGRK